MNTWRSKYFPYFGWSQNEQPVEKLNAKHINELLSFEDNTESISLNGASMSDGISSEKWLLSDQEKAIQLKVAQRVKELKEASEDQDDCGSEKDLFNCYQNPCPKNITVSESRGQNSPSEESEREHFSDFECQNDCDEHIFQEFKPEFSKIHVPEIKCKHETLYHKQNEVTTVRANFPERDDSQGELSPTTSSPTELQAPIKLQPRKLASLLMISFLIICYAWLFSNQNNHLYTLVVGSVAVFFVLLSSFFLKVNLFGSNKMKQTQIKKIKWNLNHCKEHIHNGIVTSPSFKTVTGCCCKYCRAVIEWRLIIQKGQRQNSEEEYSLGLLAVNIPPEVQSIFINFAFSAVDKNGVDLTVEITHTYTRTGDCAYSTPIKRLSSFNGKDGLLIQCKLYCEGYQTKLSWILRSLAEMLKMRIFNSNHPKADNMHVEHGRIIPVILDNVQQVGCSIDSPVNEFIRQCESQTFTWSIPYFQRLLKRSSTGGTNNMPFVLYSPYLYVVSHGVCSIWSLKLFEFQGIFRLHAKLRGLPTGTNRLQMNYIFQVQDSFGDFIIPDECGRRIKSGEYMKLWDYSRHLLYSRQTLLERFIQDDGCLCIRISLNLDPLETDLSPDFADWVQFQ